MPEARLVGAQNRGSDAAKKTKGPRLSPKGLALFRFFVLLSYQCRRFHPTHVGRRVGDSKFGAVAHLSASQTGGIFDTSVRKLPTGVAFFVDAPY
jgi:hypothetical protein